MLLIVSEKTLPGVIERDPAVGIFVPAWCHKWNVEQAVTFAAEKFRARPVQQQTAGATNADRKSHEAETYATARPLVGSRPEQNAHGSQNVKPQQERTTAGIARGEQYG